MKKTLVLLITIMMLLLFAACGEKDSDNQIISNDVNEKLENNASKDVSASEPSDEVNEVSIDCSGELADILDEISNDFDSTISFITDELEGVYDIIGDSYEGYVVNEQALTDWYALVQNEASGLYERTTNKSAEYYRLVASTMESKDSDLTDDAMDDYYDTVYDGLFDDFYDAICDGLFDNVYNKYYDGIIEAAYETVDFNEWLNVSNDCYSSWLEATSDFYSAWLNAGSGIYRNWLAVSSGFWSGNFDVDSILETEKADNSDEYTGAQEETENFDESVDGHEETESSISIDNSSDDDIRPEFKELMDSYETFFDEYVEFMKKYNNSTDTTSMLTDYMSFMNQYVEIMKNLDEVDESALSKAEALYYTKVMIRIEEKLLETAY